MTESDTDIQTSGDDAFALFEPGVADDPHPAYAHLREHCPVVRSDMDGSALALISRYEDVQWALRNPEHFTSAGGNLQLGEQPLLPLEADPPLHTEYRRILNPRFTPKAIAMLEPDVRRLVRELLDDFAGRGSCDFHAELATPLPCGLFLALVGLPMEDLPQFLEWRDNTIRPDVAPGDTESAHRIRTETAAAISNYFRGAIAARRAEPDDSLLSAIVHADLGGPDGDRPLDEAELLGICHLLLLGGLDTVTATLDCMVTYLVGHPEVRQQLVDDPTLIPDAVEELLRFLSPVMVVPRTVAHDLTLQGVDLSAGDGIALGDRRGQRRRGRLRAARRRPPSGDQQARRLRRRPPPLPGCPPGPTRVWRSSGCAGPTSAAAGVVAAASGPHRLERVQLLAAARGRCSSARARRRSRRGRGTPRRRSRRCRRAATSGSPQRSGSFGAERGRLVVHAPAGCRRRAARRSRRRSPAACRGRAPRRGRGRRRTRSTTSRARRGRPA